MGPPQIPNRRPHQAEHHPDKLPDSPAPGLPPPVGSSSPTMGAINAVRNYCPSNDYNYQDGHSPFPDPDAGEWHWQCHLCAHLNPLAAPYRDLPSIPPWIEQECANDALPPLEPSYSSRPAGPEAGSWEGRAESALRREWEERQWQWGEEEEEEEAAEAGSGSVVRRGAPAKSAYRKLLEAVPPLVGPGSAVVRTGASTGARGGGRSRAGTTEATSGKEGEGASETGAAAAAATSPSSSSSRTAACLNDADLAVSIDYAFSAAGNTRAWPSRPVRHRGVTGVRAWPGLGAAVPPRVATGYVSSGGGEGCAAAAATISTSDTESVGGQGHGFGNGGQVAAGTTALSGPSMATPMPTVAQSISDIASLARQQGFGSGARSGSKCQHRRCEGCYDLDAQMRLVRFCGGGLVPSRLYEEWYRSFNFVDDVEPLVVDGGLRGRQREWMRGGDIPKLVLEAEADEDGQGSRQRGLTSGIGSLSLGEYNDVRLAAGRRVEDRGRNAEGEKRFVVRGENVLVSRNESGALEMRADGPSRSQPEVRDQSPARYTAGESRILLVQTAEGSDDDDDDDNSEENKAANASSDDGEGFFGERWDNGGAGDGGEEREESSSDGGSHGWIEEITYIHRGSPEGGGCSESGSQSESGDTKGHDGDDEMEEEGSRIHDHGCTHGDDEDDDYEEE